MDRLRAVTDEDFAALGTISELTREGRQLVLSKTPGRAKSDGGGMSWHGSRLRIGLTQEEIELVQERVRELLEQPDLADMVEP